MQHRQLAGAFHCFAGAVETIAAQRERVAKTMARWKHPVLKKSWQQWEEYMLVVHEEQVAKAHAVAKQQLRERNLQQIGNRIVRQWKAGSVASACAAWRLRTQHHKHIYLIGARIMLRWRRLEQAVPFATWHGHAADARRLRLAADKVLRRWRNMAMAVPLVTWHENVMEGKRLRRAAQKVLARWRSMAMAVPFASWYDVFDRVRLLACMLGMMPLIHAFYSLTHSRVRTLSRTQIFCRTLMVQA